MDVLEGLETRMKDTVPEVGAAIRCGINKLVPYYSRTDMTEVYAVATALMLGLSSSGGNVMVGRRNGVASVSSWYKMHGASFLVWWLLMQEVNERAQQLHELFLTDLTTDELSEYVEQPTVVPLVNPKKADELIFWGGKSSSLTKSCC